MERHKTKASGIECGGGSLMATMRGYDRWVAHTPLLLVSQRYFLAAMGTCCPALFKATVALAAYLLFHFSLSPPLCCKDTQHYSTHKRQDTKKDHEDNACCYRVLRVRFSHFYQCAGHHDKAKEAENYPDDKQYVFH